MFNTVQNSIFGGESARHRDARLPQIPLAIRIIATRGVLDLYRTLPASNPYRASTIAEAVQAVQTGRSPVAMVSVLSDEEKQLFNKLSSAEVAYAQEACAQERYGVGSSSQGIEQVIRIWDRVIGDLDRSAFGIVRSLKELPSFLKPRFSVWHIDGSGFRSGGRHILRITLAIQGDTTQFFAPTVDEFKLFSKMQSLEIFRNVQEIITKDPTRIIQGNPYDVCIFHDNTIHRSPPNQADARITLTRFSDTKTV
jgi:hypothetical protein